MSRDTAERSKLENRKRRVAMHSDANVSYLDEDYSSGETVSIEKSSTRSSKLVNQNKNNAMEKIGLNKQYNDENRSSSEDRDSFANQRSYSCSVRSRERFSSAFTRPHLGLSKFLAALFITVSFGGRGATFLPYALKESNFRGIFMFLICGMNSFYCGLLIGWCRIMIEERWHEYKENLSSPYPAIGLKAVGKWMEYVVIIVLDSSILYRAIALMNDMASLLDEATPPDVTFCYLLILCAAVLTPLTWLGTLKNLWVVVSIAAIVMVVFIFMLVVSIFVDKHTYGPAVYDAHSPVSSMAVSFGTVSFVLSTGGAYPSIQNDMNNRKYFSQSLTMAYIIILLLYLLLSLIGYAAYGKRTFPNILNNLKENPRMRTWVPILQFLFALNLIGTFLVFMNPLFRNIEDLLKLPPEFGYKRCLSRSFIVLIILLLGLLVRQHVQFLEIVAATLLNCLTFIFPVIFYICLVFQRVSKNHRRPINKKEWLILTEILVVSISGGIAAIYSAHINLKPILVSNCYAAFLTQYNHTCFFC